MIEDTMFDNDCYAVFMEEEHEKEKRVSDLISRQDVYCILEKMMVDRPLDSDRWVIRDIDKKIKSLPSVDRPSGEWVEDTYGWVYCSHCKKYLDDYQMVFFLKPFDYCPNCGCRMIREDGEA